MVKITKAGLVRTLEISVVVVLVSLLAAFTYFRLYKETSFRVAEPLSARLVTEIDSALSKIDVVNGVQVVKVDLKRNVRYLVYADYKTPELQKMYDDFTSTRITIEIPVFSKDDVQNARIIRLMNHEFDCTPYKDTLSYTLVPAAIKHIAVVCSISIPPAFSEFKGIIAVSLSREPTEHERGVIRNVIIDISDKIYREIK